MCLEKGLVDLVEEIFGSAVVKESAFPGEDFGAVGEEEVFVGERWNEGRIHEGGGITGALESGGCTRGNATWISESVVRVVAGEAGLPRGIGERGIGKNETPDRCRIERFFAEGDPGA